MNPLTKINGQKIQIHRVINSQQHKENMKTEILITLGKKPERQGKHAVV